MSEAELDELVRRAQSRNLEALGQIYDLLYDRVYRYLLAQVHNQHLAEDLASQVFVDVMESIGRFKPERSGSFASWVFRIARNDVIDYRRRQQRRPTTDLDSAGEMADQRAEPGDQVVRAIQAEQAWTALEALTDEQRQVVLLRFGAELRTDEVASVMKKSVGAVKVLQFRAMQTLKGVMGGVA